MHKLGLKLYSTNDQYLEEASDLYRNGVYDFIELLPVPGSRGETLKSWTALRIPSVIHAPHLSFGVNLGRHELFAGNMAAAKETLLFADALNAKHVIFHPGTEGDIVESARQFKAINDPRVLVENKPYKTVDGLRRCIGGSHEEIKLVMETAGSGFCLDIGHAINFAKNIGADWYEYLLGFLAMKPAMFHFSDGHIDSGTDTHDHIGAGDYPWGRILPLIPPDALVTLETQKNSTENLLDFREDVKNYRRLMDTNVPRIVIRRAEGKDVRNVFELSNESFVRKFSINREPIGWPEHDAWFSAKIKDSCCDFYTVESDGVFVAQVRYQAEIVQMIVSLSIAAPFRGKGFASEILRTSARMVFSSRPKVDEIVAYIDPENTVSIRSFSKAGYQAIGKQDIAGHLLGKYSLLRDSI